MHEWCEVSANTYLDRRYPNWLLAEEFEDVIFVPARGVVLVRTTSGAGPGSWPRAEVFAFALLVPLDDPALPRETQSFTSPAGYCRSGTSGRTPKCSEYARKRRARSSRSRPNGSGAYS
jgi:hypothetical protein